MMDFMSAESPRVAKRIKAEVDRLQVQLDPVDTFSYSQSKVRPQHVLVTELVVNENGVIRIANNFFSGYEEADKTTLVLYGVLKGIPSFSDKGAFDLASKIKMMTQYDVGASNKPNPVGKEEFEQAVLSSIQDRELQQWDQWIRETQALRKQYQTAENHGEPATIFLESLKETEAKIKTKRFELSQKLFDRIFPNN
jgi:hypothetical protein